jgi:hypothetical protein
MITSLEHVSEFPLCWPPNKPRAARRLAGNPHDWSATLASAHQKIEDEMRRMKARGYVISMAPRHKFGSRDPGVAVWWNQPGVNGKPFELRVIACDNYEKSEVNLYAVGLTLDRLRAIERYGAYTLEQAVEGARVALPPPAREPDWWDVLKVEQHWPLVAIEAVYRETAKTAHPDQGGDPDEFKALTSAIETARKEKAP